MKKYSLTSKKFTGEVLYTFGDNGWLQAWQISGEPTKEQHEFIVSWMPANIEALQQWAKDRKLTLAEVPLEISFNAFWETYNYKVDKEEAIKEWNKLKEPEQALAITRAIPFKKWIDKKGTSLPYPVRYLRRKRYNDILN